MASAVSSVFRVPELLQQILSSLPPLDIIVLQRVCRTWHEVVKNSPLLQYKSWMTSSYSGSERVTLADTIPRLTWEQESYTFNGEYQDYKKRAEYEKKRFMHNVSTHLNPVLANVILKNMPRDPAFCFEVVADEDGTVSGSYSSQPDVLRDCVKWYAKHKDSHERWGDMSLYRLDLKSAVWDVPASNESSRPVVMRHDEGADHLTLKNLMGRVDRLWEDWKDDEEEIHYLSHDGAGCDLDRGFPESCLDRSDNEEDGGGDEDEDKDVMDELGVKTSAEFYLEMAIMSACD